LNMGIGGGFSIQKVLSLNALRWRGRRFPEGPRFGSRLNCKSTDATSAANMIQNVQEKMF